MIRRCKWTRSAQAGFTLVEVLIVTAVIGIIAAVAIPSLLQARLQARAAAIVADFHSVQHAALEFFLDHNRFPPDRQPCEEPVELQHYIGSTLLWRPAGEQFCYDWENWVRPDGTPMHPQTGILIGFSVVTQDIRLVAAIRKSSGLEVRRTVGNNYTFVIEAI